MGINNTKFIIEPKNLGINSNNKENLKGFAIYLLESHQLFGRSGIKNIEYEEKEYLVSEHEMIIGLKGWYFEKKIVCLGFMVIFLNDLPTR